MNKKKDFPAMPFYAGDWLKCPEVQALRLDHQALWFKMICFMWESIDRGVLVNPGGIPYKKEEIIRMCGLDNDMSDIWLTILKDSQVYSIRDDGAIYSRRMVRDEENRKKWSANGKKGGNPNILDKGMVNPKVNQFTEYENEYENENEDAIKKEVKNRSFIKPTIDEVEAYINQKEYSVDPVKFYAHYESNGWKVGKNKMVSWKAAIVTWVKNNG